jgi:hypothetical protein
LEPAAIPTPIDEGGTAPAEHIEALRQRLEALKPDDIARIETITAQANQAGHGISLRQKPSERRLAIATALVAWHEPGWDEDIVRDLVAAVTGDDAVTQPATPLGAVFGALTIGQANELVGMAVRVAMGTHNLEHNGRWQLAAA